MPVYRVTVNVDVDDQPLANFPIVRKITTNEAQPMVGQRVTGGGFVALPSGEMTTIAVAMLQANTALSVAFNGVTASPITVNPNGMVVLVDVALTAVSVSNTSGSTSTVKSVIAGS